VQQAFTYLYARVALAEGLLELVGEELRPSGPRLVCRKPASGKLYAAERPTMWTEAGEAESWRRCGGRCWPARKPSVNRLSATSPTAVETFG
jgi:hypothetical protein